MCVCVYHCTCVCGCVSSKMYEVRNQNVAKRKIEETFQNQSNQVGI